MIDQRTLKSFITLAETLHFGKTSDLCHMTASALTRMVQRMEEELDCVLLERNNRNVILTDSGRVFYRYAKEIQLQWQNMQSELHPDKDNISGEIRLHCTVTASYNILPEIILKLRKEYPKIRLRLETGGTQQGIEKLENNQIDATIGIMTDNTPITIRVKEIIASPLCFVASKMFSVKDQGNIIKSQPFIMPAVGPLKQLIERWLEKQHLNPEIHSYVEGHEAILSLVACGIGTAILPEIVLKNSHLLEKINIIHTAKSLPLLKVGLFMRKAVLTSIVKQKFWECVGELL